MCSTTEIDMSSGMIKRARKEADGSSRSDMWPALPGPAENPTPEGTGLLWLQEKMPSWRWYVEQARDSMQ